MKNDDVLKKVNLNIIRYANCWEDADVLLQGLKPTEGSKILSIGSAGDNSLSLLITNPEIVVAVDINKIQLHLIELKKAAIQHLSYDEMLQFLGFTGCEKRIEFFRQIKSRLSSEARAYWEKNSAIINAGIIYSGKFERYFQLFSDKILPLIHSRTTTEKIFSAKTKEEQEIFYRNVWNTWRWKFLFKIFFSRYVMGWLGRHPQLMEEVNVSVGQAIFNKAASQLQSVEAQDNFILHFALTGNFGNFFPHYARKENFPIIKSNIHRLILKEGHAQHAADRYAKFDCMNLSNIFEYMNETNFKIVSEALLNKCKTGGKLAYWNLMVARRISEILPAKTIYNQQLSEKLTATDKGFFYNKFIIDTVK